MKKYICMLAALVLLLALAGCGGQDAEPSEGQTVPGTEVETEPSVLTEQDLMKMFSVYAEADWDLVDCVVFDESACGISGVVMYTKPDYDGTMFDFIRDGRPLTTGVEAKPGRFNGVLSAIGDDRIICRLQNAEGECTYVISCIADEEGIDFKISSGGQS